MVSNREKHYVFKSLFEDNITQVSSTGGKAHLHTLSDIVNDFPQHIYWNSSNFPSDAILQFLYSVRSVSIDLLLQIAPQEKNRILINLASLETMSKCRRKTRHVTAAESLFLKNVSKANARCSSDQRCMITEGFKPFYPAMCVSPRHIQTCWHGAKFKSFYCFCPTLYNYVDDVPGTADSTYHSPVSRCPRSFPWRPHFHKLFTQGKHSTY
jgi:hypothetical protein